MGKVFELFNSAQAIVKQTTHLSSSIGTPPVSLFEERSTSIGLRADIESKKLLGMSSTRSLSENSWCIPCEHKRMTES